MLGILSLPFCVSQFGFWKTVMFLAICSSTHPMHIQYWNGLKKPFPPLSVSLLLFLKDPTGNFEQQRTDLILNILRFSNSAPISVETLVTRQRSVGWSPSLSHVASCTWGRGRAGQCISLVLIPYFSDIGPVARGREAKVGKRVGSWEQ